MEEDIKYNLLSITKLINFFHGIRWPLYANIDYDMAISLPNQDMMKSICEIFGKTRNDDSSSSSENNEQTVSSLKPLMDTIKAKALLAEYFGNKSYNDMKAENVFITCGAHQGLFIVLTQLVASDGFIFIDEVSYNPAYKLFKTFGSFRLIPVSINKNGVVLKKFEKLLQQHHFKAKENKFWALYFTVPVYHNPMGICFTTTVCKGLISLARTFDMLIICDDVYNDLYYGDKAPKRLMAYDNKQNKDYKGHVISNGSLSKYFSPCVGLGWLEVPARLKNLLDESNMKTSGDCFNNQSSHIFTNLFGKKLAQPHIKFMRETLKDRMKACCQILDANLPTGCSFIRPLGGYYIWVRLPLNMDAKDLLDICATNEKIYFMLGTDFEIKSGVATNCFRLTIVFLTKEKLQEAILKICACIQNLMEPNAKMKE